MGQVASQKEMTPEDSVRPRVHTLLTQSDKVQRRDRIKEKRVNGKRFGHMGETNGREVLFWEKGVSVQTHHGFNSLLQR